MAETKNPGEKLKVSSKTLSLKREQGVVRQSFSHGRTKQVVVEKVKRRTVGDKEAAPPVPERAAPKRGAAGKAAAETSPAPSPGAAASSAKPSGVVLRTLTEE